MAHSKHLNVIRPDASREKGLDAAGATKVVKALAGVLGSTYTLYHKALFYHWNVTGPQFSSLHTLFEQHYQALHLAGDEVAERIRALGAFAPGTLSELRALSAVKEDDALPENAQAMIIGLLEGHEFCAADARKTCEIAEDAGDQVTADMMVSRMRFHDTSAWMLRALLD